MSYDLDFWKYKPGVILDHQHVYERLSAGEHVNGLEDLPIDQLLQRITQAFSVDWTRGDDQTWESKRGTFQVFTTDQFLRVDCYGLAGEDMNQFIEIAQAFGCPLYDPQVMKRYEG